MEDAAGTLAREGEHILWSGMAEDYDPFADDMRKATIRRFAICFGTAVLLDLFYIVATIASGTGEFHLLMPLVVLLVAGIIAWSPFTDRSLVLQNAAYFLTDTSIVVATEGVHFASLPAAFGQRDQATGNAECENQKKPILAPAHFCHILYNRIIISRANATLHVYWDIVIYIHPEIAFPTPGVTRC